MSFSSKFKHLHSLHVTMSLPDVVIKAFTPLWTEARKILTLGRNSTSPRAHLTSGKSKCSGNSLSIHGHQFSLIRRKSQFQGNINSWPMNLFYNINYILNFNKHKIFISWINSTTKTTKIGTAKFSYR